MRPASSVSMFPTEDHSSVLTRAALEAGGIEAIYKHDGRGVQFLGPDEREESLQAFLSARPAGPLWVFGYGSLMWNPAVKVVECRKARAEGWHRSFCLSAIAGRGSPDAPGLFLGLDQGGCCTGIAFRIAETDIGEQLSLLWRREMTLGGYIPRWIDLIDDAGHAIGAALTFAIDRNSHLYAGDLPVETVIDRLATARGGLGSNADYLFRTGNSLHELDILDPVIEHLVQKVDAVLSLSVLQEAA